MYIRASTKLAEGLLLCTLPPQSWNNLELYLLLPTFALYRKKMKYLNVGEAVQRALTREVQVMKNMNSESVIKLYDHFQLDAYLYIVMEYSPMGDLEGYIRKKGCTDVETVSQMMTEIGTCLAELRRS
jgi:serine/threonine protein kinase